MLELNPQVRGDLANRILACLATATPGSVVELRGSLAVGCADLYSDIGICWEVPDGDFGASIEQLPRDEQPRR